MLETDGVVSQTAGDPQEVLLGAAAELVARTGTAPGGAAGTAGGRSFCFPEGQQKRVDVGCQKEPAKGIFTLVFF